MHSLKLLFEHHHMLALISHYYFLNYGQIASIGGFVKHQTSEVSKKLLKKNGNGGKARNTKKKNIIRLA